MTKAISNITSAAQSLSNLILATPNLATGYQPQTRPLQSGEAWSSEPGFLFNFEGEQTLTLESDITDHYIEDNSAINDQIALKPIIITTEGFISELTDIVPKELQFLKDAADKLTVLGGYTPVLTIAAQEAYNLAKFGYSLQENARNSFVSRWGNDSESTAIIGSGGLNLSEKQIEDSRQTKQQKAFQKFYGWWRNRTLFTVQTPWAVFQNCAIMSLRPVQGPEDRTMTSFDITFKVLNFASDVVKDSSYLDRSGRSNAQANPTRYLGNSSAVQSISAKSTFSRYSNVSGGGPV